METEKEEYWKKIYYQFKSNLNYQIPCFPPYTPRSNEMVTLILFFWFETQIRIPRRTCYKGDITTEWYNCVKRWSMLGWIINKAGRESRQFTIWMEEKAVVEARSPSFLLVLDPCVCSSRARHQRSLCDRTEFKFQWEPG